MKKTLTTLVTLGVIFVLAFPAYRYAVDTYATATGDRPKTKSEATAAYIESTKQIKALNAQYESGSITFEDYERGIASFRTVKYPEASNRMSRGGITVDSSSYRITKRGDSYWYFSSNITISNRTSSSVTIFVNGQFLDASGFIIDDYPAKVVIGAYSTSIDRHQAMIELPQARQVVKFEVAQH